jgi:hypothetical protein
MDMQLYKSKPQLQPEAKVAPAIHNPIEETIDQIDSVEYPKAYPDVVDSPRQIHSQFTLMSISGRSTDKGISISDRER